jgi:diketogulonate reductase-like aldo/keto reductase
MSKFELPPVGLGVFQVSNENELYDSIRAAVEAGYTHFDTAFAYGNEKFLGNVLRELIKEGKISREQIQITTKLWSTMHREVEKGCRISFENLDLGPIELYIVHNPVSLKSIEGPGRFTLDLDVDLMQVWKDMEKLVALGLVKNIGVSNFTVNQLKRILDICTIKPFCNQIEIHLLHQNTELVDFCKQNGILPVAFSPLAQKPLDILFTLPKLQEVASKHGKTMGQVALKFLLQQGITIIPKSTNPKRIKENIDLFNFELTSDEIKDLAKEGQANPKTIVDYHPMFERFKDHPEYPY